MRYQTNDILFTGIKTEVLNPFLLRLHNYLATTRTEIELNGAEKRPELITILDLALHRYKKKNAYF